VHFDQGDTIVAEKGHLTRKQIKQPDEFIALSGQVLTWIRANQQLVIVIGAGLAILVAVVGIAGAYRAAQRRDANADLARALSKYDGSDFGAAATQLDEVAARWSGTQVAALATLLAANSALRAGEADKALTALSGLQSASLPVYLQQQHLVAWGAALELKQQWSDSATKFKDAAALNGPYTGEAIVGQARAQEKAGDAAKAKELYRQAYEQFPEMPGRDLLATKFQS
jgi:predicted negative regulator of RcsB-dependent stress response